MELFLVKQTGWIGDSEKDQFKRPVYLGRDGVEYVGGENIFSNPYYILPVSVMVGSIFFPLDDKQREQK